MFDKYLIVGEEFHNLQEGSQVIGYQLGVRLPYYRGVVLSLVGEMVLTVDEERVPMSKMTVTVGGKTYPVDKLEDETEAKWEFGEVGIVKVARPGGLKHGEHKVELTQHMKISYVPNGFVGRDAKTLKI
jgi:Domain of unknown function (DUF6379)